MFFDLSFCGLISCRYQISVNQAKTLTFSPFLHLKLRHLDSILTGVNSPAFLPLLP